jgi:hypothetical protein
MRRLDNTGDHCEACGRYVSTVRHPRLVKAWMCQECLTHLEGLERALPNPKIDMPANHDVCVVRAA